MEGKNTFCPLSGGVYDTIYCAEGKLAFSIPYGTNEVQSSILIMRNGVMEVVDAKMMNWNKPQKKTYKWIEVEQLLYRKMREYGELLDKLNVPRPWYISVGIVNGKGYRTSTAYNGLSEILHSEYIQSVDCIWNEDQHLSEIIPPCFNALANAFGYKNLA